MRKAVIATAICLLAAAALGGEAVPGDLAGPRNVLVVYNRLSADNDRNGKPDGQEAAEYYAARRGVPAENLLALELKAGRLNYLGFFEKILTPVRKKLHSKATDGKPFAERIHYIMLTPGIPTSMDTGHTKDEHPIRPGRYSAKRRSVDQWLISVEANFAAGVQKETARPGPVGSLKLGGVRINGKPLAIVKVGKLNLGAVKVGGKPLAAVPVTKEGKLGEMIVAGKKLGDYPVEGGKLGDIEVGTGKKPLKLGEVDVRMPALGSRMGEISLPLVGRFVRAGSPGFGKLRSANPRLAGCYLVTRLGKDLDSARRSVDGALYAERYLRGAGGGTEAAAPKLAIWLDQKYNFARDQVAAQVRCTALVHNWEKGLFKPRAAGPLAPWKLVIDNQSTEIGLRGKGKDKAHRPTATAEIEKVLPGNVLVLKTTKFGRRQVPVAAYFSPGWEIRVRGEGAKAVIRSVDPAKNQLVLSSTEGFKAGGGVISTWAGAYPATDCFYFFGFYGLGRFEDVFAFPPGAIGIHVDSSCMRWAHGSLGRGIAATYGVVNEPFSAGIPYGDLALAALVRGHDLAEAMTGAVRFGQRWAGVIFGDPLYAPFRGKKLADGTEPVLAEVSAKSEKAGVRVVAHLGGKTADQLADVALFRIEYGADAKYGQKLDFYAWPDPENPGRRVKGRNYSGYARACSRLITGLKKGQTYHYRVVARDPAGNQSTSPDATFRY